MSLTGGTWRRAAQRALVSTVAPRLSKAGRICMVVANPALFSQLATAVAGPIPSLGVAAVGVRPPSPYAMMVGAQPPSVSAVMTWPDPLSQQIREHHMTAKKHTCGLTGPWGCRTVWASGPHVTLLEEAQIRGMGCEKTCSLIGGTCSLTAGYGPTC